MKKKWIVILGIIIVIILFTVFSEHDSEVIRPPSTRFTYEIILEPIYDDILDVKYNAIRFKKDGKLGCFIVGKGEVIPAMYDMLTYHRIEDIFTARIDDGRGAIDMENQIIIPFEYEYIRYMGRKSGRKIFQVKKDGSLYYIDGQNNRVEDEIEPSDFPNTEVPKKFWFLERTVYTKQQFFINTLVDEDGSQRYGIGDSDGKQIIPCDYLHFEAAFDERMMIVTGFDNRKGVIKIVPLQQTQEN